jgi:hypothetical protein
MTVDDPRTTSPTHALPRPRAPQDDVETERTPEAPRPGEFPWPVPWHYSRGARPRSEYWDTASASWHSRGPVVPPRTD